MQLKELLNIVKPTGKYVLTYSKDVYTTNTLIKYLFTEDVIIAYKMNGNILPLRHGFPLRLIIPKLYAWKSTKYLSDFEFWMKINKVTGKKGVIIPIVIHGRMKGILIKYYLL